MSVENEKVCCTCRHCIRKYDEMLRIFYHHCEKKDCYLSYAEHINGWCRHWAKDKEVENDG